MRPAAIAIALFFPAFLANPARAERRPAIAVLDLEVIDAGRGIDAATVQLGQNITSGLRRAARMDARQYQLAQDSERTLVEMKALGDCAEEARPCMARIGRDLGADALLYGKLQKTGDGYLVTLTLFDVASQTRQFITRELTAGDVANPDQLATQSLDLYRRATDLARKDASRRENDGPADRTGDSDRAVAQSFERPPGQPESLAVTPEPLQPTSGPRRRKLGWVFLSTGVALAGLGVVGIAIDGPRIENGVRQSEKWTTLYQGIAGTAAGTVLVGSAIYLLATDGQGRGERSASEKSVTLQVWGDGVGLGLAGLF